MRIDLNADMGEGYGPWQMGDDAAMLGLVTTANIACGFHAGDPDIMRASAEAARDRGVAVGAHPGYADLHGFGRRPLPGLGLRTVENLVAYQIGAFQAVCAAAAHPMTHVKTHGALGNACADDDALADAVARAIRAVDPGLGFLVMPGTATERAADRAGLRGVAEVYADRSYADSFNLTPRGTAGAMIHDPAEALERVLRMLDEGALRSVSGKRLPVRIESICVHGDNPAAVAMAQALRSGLEAADCTLAPFAWPDGVRPDRG